MVISSKIAALVKSGKNKGQLKKGFSSKTVTVRGKERVMYFDNTRKKGKVQAACKKKCKKVCEKKKKDTELVELVLSDAEMKK